MHWTYKEPPFDPDLEQGDILSCSDYITTILQKYHPYYADHPLNDFFIVLTQSCDLTRRNNEIKTPYVTLAPVRPLRAIIERESNRYLRNVKPGAKPFATVQDKNRLEEFLERIFNNNNPRYFFLERQPDMQLPEDMCAVLSLGISIKAEHYEECLKARILQLKPAFQAKLGWLVGHSFSRVATNDWTDESLRAKTEQTLNKAAVWLNDDVVRHLERRVAEHEGNHPDQPIDETLLATLISEHKGRKDEAIDAIFDVLEREGMIEAQGKQRFALRKTLRSDSVFSRFFK